MPNIERHPEWSATDQFMAAQYLASRDQNSPFDGSPKIVVAVHDAQSGGSLSLTMLMVAGMACLSPGNAMAAPTSPGISPWALNQLAQPTASSGFRRKFDVSSVEMLTNVRLKLGLTWAQLATLFDVSRRTVHAWGSGEKLNARHDARLRDLYSQVGDAKSLPALRQELLGVTDEAKGYTPALKGAILSSAELGLSGSRSDQRRRVSSVTPRQR